MDPVSGQGNTYICEHFRHPAQGRTDRIPGLYAWRCAPLLPASLREPSLS
jgi:hypothetical protein